MIIVANETIAKSTRKADSVSEVAFKDMEYFVSNTEMQLNFVTKSSFERTLTTIDFDMESKLFYLK